MRQGERLPAPATVDVNVHAGTGEVDLVSNAGEQPKALLSEEAEVKLRNEPNNCFVFSHWCKTEWVVKTSSGGTSRSGPVALAAKSLSTIARVSKV